MKRAEVIEHLELALIELEYASADFAQRSGARRGGMGFRDIEPVAMKMQAANKAMQIALAMLEARPEMQPEPGSDLDEGAYSFE